MDSSLHARRFFEVGPKGGTWPTSKALERSCSETIVRGGPDDTLMPPGIPQKYKGYGWHQDESRLILVTREPRMYRIPEDPSYGLRTTWLRTAKGWAQFEKQVRWSELNPKTPKFEEWGDRGVFIRKPPGRPQRRFTLPLRPTMSRISSGALSIQVRVD